jgi:hypothetical protein
MLRFFTVLSFTFFVINGIFAQQTQDTIYYENFNKQPKITVQTLPYLSDTSLVLYDQDGGADAGNRSKNWFLNTPFAPQDTAAKKVYASSSWLFNQVQNRNYMVLPRFWVLDANTSISWKSAPYQAPRYLDGYAVVVSVSGSNGAADFTDTIFRAAQMIPNANGSLGIGKDISTYSFSQGYVHANGLTDTLYFKKRSTTALDTNVYNCLLEPHTISLAAYVGRHISVAFLHQSDDDNMISIDDILIKGQKIRLSAQNNYANPMAVFAYPNPTRSNLNIEYNLKNTAVVSAFLYDVQGKVVWQQPRMLHLVGAHYHKINVENMPKGSYVFKLNVAGAGVFSQMVLVD